MKSTSESRKAAGRPASGRNVRRGVFMVLGVICLVVVAAFVAMSVDLGIISLNKTRMQNAVDAAALAAAREIGVALNEAAQNANGGDVEGQVQDANEIAVNAAKDMAVKVAELNGVYIDPDQDVRFGQRHYNAGAGTYSIQWDVSPYNVVGVTARRDDSNADAPDGQIRLLFAPIFGEKWASVTAAAAAYIESRDIVMVLDFSASMNDDSTFESSRIQKLGQAAIEANLLDMYEALGSPVWGNLPFTPDWVTVPGTSGSSKLTCKWKSTSVDVVHWKTMTQAVLTFTNNGTQTFNNVNAKTKTFAGTGSNANKIIKSIKVYPASSGTNNTNETVDFYTDATIIKGLGLTNVAYPFNSGSWAAYVQYARDTSGSYYDSIIDTVGYRRKFGVMTFLDFLMKNKESHAETEDLWKTPHYPFHAMKEGATMFTNFLSALEFGDHVGLVSYDTNHRVETTLNEDGENIDISSSPITNNYTAIDTIQRHKQAGHYLSTTNIGGGLWDARKLLDDHGRYGARPTILLMTDGIANVVDGNFSLPQGWNWAALTDYNNDGTADYTTTDKYKQYAFFRAKEAIDKGVTIHTLAIGVDADRAFMKAIAYAGGGEFIDIPYTASTAEMQAVCETAFARIAANVPPAKLLNDGE